MAIVKRNVQFLYQCESLISVKLYKGNKRECWIKLNMDLPVLRTKHSVESVCTHGMSVY